MATLAPVISSGVGYEQPIEQPSALAGVANLAGAFVQAYRAAPEKKVTETDRLGIGKRNFYATLDAGRALIEQGQTDKGTRLIRQGYRKFSIEYGREHADVNAAFQDATGISFDVEVTGSPVRTTDITNTAEFSFNVEIASRANPNATADEIFDTAYATTVKRFETDQRIKDFESQEKLNWFDVEEVFVDKARQVGDIARAMVASAEKDDIITVEEAKIIRDFYNTQIANVTKPPAISQERWDKYQEDYLTPLNTLIDGAIGLGTEYGFSSDMSRAMDRIIAKAMSQDKLPGGLLIKFNPGEKNNYEATLRLLSDFREDDRWRENVNFVLNASYSELLNWVTDFESKTNFDELMLDTKPFENLTDADKEQYLKDSANLISPNSPPEQVVLDLLNINSSFEALAQRAVQPQDFETIFNPAYFQSVKKVFEANPVIGRKVAQDAVRVIDSQSIAIARALESEARQLGFRIQAGVLVPDPDLMPVEYSAIVEMHFGGDWDAAIAARGTDAKGITYNPIRAMTNTIRNNLAPKVKKFEEATRVVNQLKETFLTEDVTGITAGGGADELQGGQGEDILDASDGNTLTLDLIRQKEGFREKAYWDVNAWRTGYGSDTVTRADGTIEKVTEDTVVTREDAERDLARRTREFQLAASRKIGTDIWTNMPGNVTAALTSIAYNYGSIPDRLLKSARSGDWEALATAVEGLAGDNRGINRARRMREAAIIRGKELPPSAAPVYTAPPRQRPPIDTNIPQRATESLVQGDVDIQATEVAQDEGRPAAEAPRASPEATERARKVWSTLSEETKATLARILGTEEEAIRMLAERELSEEDVMNVN